MAVTQPLQDWGMATGNPYLTVAAMVAGLIVAGVSLAVTNAYSIAAHISKKRSSTRKLDKPCTQAWVGEKDIYRGNRLTKSQAINQVRLGKSVMCDSRRDAREVASSAFFRFDVEINKTQKAGYYYYKHFHPKSRNGAHIWFLFE